MINCELCGGKDATIVAEIEGIQLKVCEKCSRHGKIIRKETVTVIRKPKKAMPQKHDEEVLVSDFSTMIKKARESRNLKQEELAQKISEKASLIHQIESHHIEPPLNVAKKLEKFFKIQLIKKIESNPTKESKKTSPTLTVGDVIKIKDE